jgi:hypothetical protein
MGEAIHLLKVGGPNAAVYYYLGTLPFVLAFLRFWDEMSRSAFAGRHMVPASLLIAAAFVWMKGCQALFCRCLYQLRAGLPLETPVWQHWRRIFANQAALQPWGLVLLPLSLLMMVPFAALYAFFQNLSVLDDGGPQVLLVREARLHARLWPMQNYLIVWILSPWLLGITLVLGFAAAVAIVGTGAYELFDTVQMPWLFVGVLLLLLGAWPACPLALTVAINVGLLFLVIPWLLNSFFGVETVFVRSPLALANSTSLLAIYSVTHLLLDPAVKAAYVLRCFYGRAVASGEDILVELRALVTSEAEGQSVAVLDSSPRAEPKTQTASRGQAARKFAQLVGRISAIVFVTMLLYPQRSPAASATADGASAERLDAAIVGILERPEYAWRIPRPPVETTEDGWIERHLRALGEMVSDIVASLGKWVKKVFEWIRDLFANDASQPDERRTLSWWVKLAAFVLSIVAALLGLWQFMRLYRHRKRPLPTEQVGVPVTQDLSAESIGPDHLPENEWLELARRMLAENRPRLALRALYFASLAHLDRHRVIRIVPSKSSGEYAREIARYRRSYPHLPRLFAESTRVFERVWYGDYAVSDSDLRHIDENWNQIRGFIAGTGTQP